MKTILFKESFENNILLLNDYESMRNIKGAFNLVYEIKDNLLDWCNDYADYFEADRFLGQYERDSSIRDIYLSILDGDLSYVNDEELLLTSDGKELLERLEHLLRK